MPSAGGEGGDRIYAHILPLQGDRHFCIGHRRNGVHASVQDGFEGEPIECNEGVLEWVPKESVESLNLWEGDKIFFRLLNNNGPFFSLKLVYDKDGDLVSAALDGREMKIQGPYIPSADELTEAALFSACMPQTTESTATKEEAVLHKPEMQKSGLRRILWAAALFAAVLIAGAALFLFSLTCCGGKVRVHLLAAACAGFAVWYFFAGVPLRAASDGAVRALHRAAACVRRAFSRVEKYAERLRERLRPIPEKVKKSCKKNRKPS